MDANGEYKSNLGNEKNLSNAEKDKVTAVRTSDLRKKNDPPVIPSSQKSKGSPKEA